MSETRTHRKVRGKVGRPTELTPKVYRRILKYIREGCYVETAVACAGVPKETFYRWLRRGAEDLKDGGDNNSIFARFCDAIPKAASLAERDDLEIIRRAAQKNWTAAAWRLERKSPQRYGRVNRIPDDDDENPQGREFILNYDLKDDDDAT